MFKMLMRMSKAVGSFFSSLLDVLGDMSMAEVRNAQRNRPHCPACCPTEEGGTVAKEPEPDLVEHIPETAWKNTKIKMKFDRSIVKPAPGRNWKSNNGEPWTVEE